MQPDNIYQVSDTALGNIMPSDLKKAARLQDGKPEWKNNTTGAAMLTVSASYRRTEKRSQEQKKKGSAHASRDLEMQPLCWDFKSPGLWR